MLSLATFCGLILAQASCASERRSTEWDAQEQYWAGHGWQSADPWQPVLNGNYNLNFPMEFTDLRFWRRGGLNRFDATQSCAGLLNANEMSWYVMYGDPR